MYNISSEFFLNDKLKGKTPDQIFQPKLEPIIKSTERKSQKIKFDNSLEDIYII